MRRIRASLLFGILSCEAATFAQAPAGQVVSQAAPSPSAVAARFLAIDKDGHPITDLQANDVRLRVSKDERKILSLTLDANAPKTIGLFFDMSGSRRSDKLIAKEVQSIRKFLDSVWQAKDAGFVISFNDRPYTEAKPTGELPQIYAGLQAILTGANYRGSTALYDALCSVHSTGPQTGSGERLFLVVSDFDDNSSKLTEEKMVEQLREEGVRIFPLLLEGTSEKPTEIRRGRKSAKDAAEKTGGDVLLVKNEPDLDQAFARLAKELQGAYRLEYEPATEAVKKRKLQIETTRPNTKLLYARD